MTATAADTERRLLAQMHALRFQAPNPRDFRSWDDFAAAQSEHEAKVAALQAEIDKCAPW